MKEKIKKLGRVSEVRGKIQFLFAGLIFIGIFGFPAGASAMHIMEGFLPLPHAVVWGVISAPFVVAGFLSIRKTLEKNRKLLMILVMVSAFAFVLSALKIPSVTGSSSHPTGTGLGAILFGPLAMAVIGLIVLLFQAILLAHGGLTTLGANTFSMAIVGPFVAFALYKLSMKLGAPKTFAVFIAASIGNLSTYVVTAFQLALAHPAEIGGFAASLTEFLTIFAVTQIPLAIIEGLLTVVVIKALEGFAEPELRLVGYLGGEVR